MPTPTYDLIGTATGTGSSAEVSFTSIPSTYKDLVLIAVLQPSNANTVPGIYFNGSTATTCSTTYVQGNGTNATSSRTTGQGTLQPFGLTTGQMSTTSPAILRAEIQSYSNTTTNKTTLFRFDAAYSLAVGAVGLWQSTSAISQINISTLNGAYFWTTNSTFYLFGVSG